MIKSDLKREVLSKELKVQFTGSSKTQYVYLVTERPTRFDSIVVLSAFANLKSVVLGNTILFGEGIWGSAHAVYPGVRLTICLENKSELEDYEAVIRVIGEELTGC